MVDGNFQKLENGLSRQSGLSRGGRSRQVSWYSCIPVLLIWYRFPPHRLERLEAGARDPSQFLEWQNKMRQADLDEKLADIERRRLEGKLSHEEAILARQTVIRENRQKVQQWKEEVRIL